MKSNLIRKYTAILIMICFILININPLFAYVSVSGISLNQKSLTIITGDSETLVATVTPDDATNKEVTWISNDTAVVTVDENGLVTGISEGTASIIVNTKEGNFTAECLVKVETDKAKPLPQKGKKNNQAYFAGAANTNTDRYIIKYKNEKSEQEHKDIVNTLKGNLKSVKGNKKFDFVTTKSKIKSNDLLAELNKNNTDSNIEYIQPDYQIDVSSNDTYFDLQWGVYNQETVAGSVYDTVSGTIYSDIRIDANIVPAWEISEGADTLVAVIDTGIDITHEDLTDNIWQNNGEIPDNGIDDDQNGYIDDINGWNIVDGNNLVYNIESINDEMHGTNIAGVISAVIDNNKGIAGVAPASKIMPIKAFQNGIAYTSNIIEAIDYAAGMGTKIVNCSWGSNEVNQALQDTMEQYDMLFICAAGNSNKDIDVEPVSPASFDSLNIISVASLNKNGYLSDFSNFGLISVDVAAPGEEIACPSPGNGYSFCNGTSMAAAFVTGEAALILQNNSSFTVNDIKMQITNSCDHYSSLVNKVAEGQKINVYNSVIGYFPELSSLINIPDIVPEDIIEVTGVSLNKTTTTINAGNNETLEATVNPVDASNSNIIWSSSDTSVATVNLIGTVTGISAGTATITATTADGGFTATCIVEVTQDIIAATGVSLNKTSTIINIGGSETLTSTIYPENATNQDVTWSSSDTEIATVDLNGTVTGISAGTVTITVTTNDGGYTATCVVEVTRTAVAVIGVSLNKTSTVINEGEWETLIATIEPEDATGQTVSWNSSDTSVVMVDAYGVIYGVSEGLAEITVTTIDGGYTASCNVEVIHYDVPVTGINLNKNSTSIYINESELLYYTIAPFNAANQSVTWSTSDETVATVVYGEAIGIGPGTAIITATTEDGGYSASCEVEVKPIDDLRKLLIKYNEESQSFTTNSYVVNYENYNEDDCAISEQILINNYSSLNDQGVYAIEIYNENMELFMEDSNIELVEEDGVVKKSGDIITWNVNKIKAPVLHSSGYYGNGIKVAVFDTGIDLNNDELNVVGGASFVDGVLSYDDDNGHGTAVAGVLCAAMNDQGLLGVAPEVSLYAVKVLDSNGVGRYSNIIKGMQWAIENDIDIIVMSFGGSQYSTLLREAIQDADRHGILITAASGNEGNDDSIDYPANFCEVICVGATDSNDNIAYFSNKGFEMDLVAPGNDIQTTGLNNSIVTMNGTSAAVSHVAGVAAQLWSIKRELTNNQMKVLLYKSAYSLGKKEVFGWGLVDAEKAFQLKDTDLNVSPLDYNPSVYWGEDVGGDGTVTASAQIIEGGYQWIVPWQQQARIKIRLSNAHLTGDMRVEIYKNQTRVYGPITWIRKPAAGDYVYYCPDYVLSTPNTTYYVVFSFTDPPYNTSPYRYTATINTEDFGNNKNNSSWVYEGQKSGRINYGGDKDFFKFRPTRTTRFTIKLSSSNFIACLYKGSSKLKEGSNFKYDLDEDELYYIEVKYKNSSGGGSYTLSINGVDDDYGNTFDDAKSIQIGNTVYGNIQYYCDDDYFTFTTGDAGKHTIDISGISYTSGVLYDKYHNQITSRTGSSFRLEALLQPNQKYYIRIRNNNGNTGSYNLKVNRVSDDHGNSFNYATTITPTTNGTTLNCNINYIGDIDFFKFNTLGRGTYKIEKTGSTSTSVILYNSNKQVINNADGTSCSLVYPVISDDVQTLFIRVSNSTNGTAGQYTLKITFIPDTVVTPEELIIRYALGDPNWCKKVGEPVNVITGNYYSENTDLSIPTRSIPLEFIRSYNSRSEDTSPIGKGWQHNHNAFLKVNSDNSVLVTYGDGHSALFTLENSVYKRPDGCYETLVKNGDGTYTLTFKDQLKHNFNSNGKMVSIVDKNNNVTTLQYSGTLLSSVTEPGGRSLQFTYNASNYLTCVTDPAGRTLEFTYDSNGNQLTFKDVKGEVTTYTYDANGLTSILDPLNHYIVRNTYDSEGRVTQQLDSKGQVITIAYDTDNRKNTYTDARNNVTYYYYDDKYRTTKIEYSGGDYEAYTYDINYNRLSERDARGNTTTYTYDAMGNMLTKKDPLNTTPTTYTYNSMNNLTSVTDTANHTITNVYDVKGNLTSSSKTVSGTTVTTTYTYDAYGQVTGITNPNNKTTTFTYDNHGNILTTTDPLNNTGSFTYDNVGREITKTDQRDKIWTYTYDNEDKILTEEDPLNNITAYTYDTVGNLTAKTDAWGKTTTFEYDENDRQIEIKDPLNNRIIFEYDANGNKTGVTDARGNKTIYAYDARNRLTSVTDPRGNSESYTLDGNGNIISKTDKRGNTTTYEYDILNRCTKITDPLGGITQFQYDVLGNKIAQIDAENRTTTFTYNEASQLLSITEPLNKTTTFTYDAVGNKKSMVNSNGDTWEYTFDDNNHLISEKDPLQNIIQTAYDQAGNITNKTDARGKVTTYEYDDRGLPIEVTAPLNQITTFTYDANGNKTAVVDANNHTTTYEYDDNNRLVKITGPDNKSETYILDANGNITQKTDRKGGVITYQYDELNRQTSITDPLNGITQLEYDGNGNKTKVTDPNNKQYTYVYDDLNRLTSLTDPENHTTSYTYDSVGNRLSQSDPTGATWNYEYDDLNQLIKTTDPLGNINQNGYDKVGNITTKTDANNNTTTYTYDARSLITSVTDAKGNTTTYGYDANGNLTTVTDANGVTKTFEYDDLNRQIQETDSQGMTKTKTYDPIGNLISRIKIDGNTITYTYDQNNRLSNIIYPDNTQVSYTYDDLGARTSMTDSNGTSTYTYDALSRLKTVTRDGQTITYDYDPAGNITKLTYPDGSQVDYTYNNINQPITITESGQTTSITYDQAGRRNGETLPNNTTVDYQYDTAGRLTLIDHRLDTTSLAKSGYTLDPNGNRLIKTDETDLVTTYTYDQLNQLTQALYPNGRTVDYTYDAVGNRSNTVDSQGGMPASETKDYTYDYENRLIQFQNGSQTITYTYDGDGNLIQKTVNDGTNTDTYKYLYDYSAGLPRLLVEKKNSSEEYKYLYAGRLFSRKGPEGTVYYHQDGLGSTLAITDAAGQVLNKYTYDAYGEVLAIQENVYNAILFTGEMQDESGLIYLRARFYDPATGRFTVEDTLFGELDNPLTQNLYAYCMNNPVNYTDPSGHERCGLYVDYDAIGDYINNYIEEYITGFLNYSAEKIEDIAHYSPLICQIEVLTGRTFIGGRELSYAELIERNDYISDFWMSAPLQLTGGIKEVGGSGAWLHIEGMGKLGKAPQKAYDVAEQVAKNNGAPPKGYKGGRVFQNDTRAGGQKLPEGVNYKEYDVNPFTKGQNRGAERIVVGDDGSIWYTNDHYNTFTRIK